MPTYTVTNSNFNLTSKEQKKLAEGITKVHNCLLYTSPSPRDS